MKKSKNQNSKGTDVLFVIPPKVRYADQLKRIAMPIGVLSIASYIRQAGISSAILDAAAEGWDREIETGVLSSIDGKELLQYGLSDEQIIARIREYDPKIIGVSTAASSQIEPTLATTALIKQSFPDVKVVIGGNHVSHEYGEILKNESIDFVVRSEGERSFLELSQAILQERIDQQSLSSITGIAYMDDGRVVSTVPRQFISDLDALPFPAYDLIGHIDYGGNRFHGGIAKNEKIAEFFTTRGCPMTCDFCGARAMHGNRWRKNSEEYIESHLNHLINLGYREIVVEDDNFFVDKKRALRIMKLFKEKGLVWTEIGGVSISQLVKGKKVDTAFIDHIADSGGYRMYLALETPNLKIMTAAKKQQYFIEPSLAGDVVNYLNQRGISVFGGFMIGFESESISDVVRTAEYAKWLRTRGMDYAILFNVTPVPGTQLGTRNKEKLCGIMADFSFERRNFDTDQISSRDLNSLWPILMSYVNGEGFDVWQKEGRWA